MAINPKTSLFIGIICISFSPIFVKIAGVSPVGAAFYRVFIAWLCLFPYCLIRRKLKVEKKQLFTAIIAGVVFAIDIAVWNISLLKISATVSTLIANLAPVWVGLLSYILFKKLSGSLFWIGTVVAIRFRAFSWLVACNFRMHGTTICCLRFMLLFLFFLVCGLRKDCSSTNYQ